MNDLSPIQEQQMAVAPSGSSAMLAMIERVVMSPDADLEKLERMLAMKERIDAQGASVAFAAALAAARAEIPPIIKDATVDFTGAKGRTHYRHETLAGIAKAIDPVLSRYGLSYRFRTEQGQGCVKVTCIVAHAQGHSEETSLACAPDGSGSKNPFQAVGSAVTYLQRYTLKAALGLSAEVDDDGQAAAPRPGDRRDDRQQQAREPERLGPTIGDQRMAEQMVISIKQNGKIAVDDPNLKRDLDTLRQRAPELAAMVEVQIEACMRDRGLTGEVMDEIPYEGPPK